MNTNYLSLVIICLLFFGNYNTFAENSGSIMEVSSQNEHDHEKELEKLKLNNGEKWEVNEEMMPHVRKAEEILENYLSDDNEKDHNKLARTLNEQNKKLISFAL